MEAHRQSLTSSLGLLILRLGASGYLLMHGWGKLQMMLDGNFEKFPDPLGVGNGVSLVLIFFAEFVCAVLVMAGLATRFAAVPVVIAMAVAAFVVHADDPWTMGQGASKEPALLYLIAFLTLVFTGAGRCSVDGWFRRRRRKQNAG